MNYEHEVVVPRAGMPFKIDIFEGAGGNYTREPHWHNSVEIFAIYEGSLVFILREKKIRVESGEFILIYINELHSIRAEKANLAVYVQIPISEFKNYLTADHFISFHKKGKGAMADLDPAQMEENEKKMMTLIRNIYDLTGTDVPGHESRNISKSIMRRIFPYSLWRSNLAIPSNIYPVCSKNTPRSIISPICPASV